MVLHNNDSKQLTFKFNVLAISHIPLYFYLHVVLSPYLEVLFVFIDTQCSTQFTLK